MIEENLNKSIDSKLNLEIIIDETKNPNNINNSLNETTKKKRKGILIK